MAANTQPSGNLTVGVDGTSRKLRVLGVTVEKEGTSENNTGAFTSGSSEGHWS